MEYEGKQTEKEFFSMKFKNIKKFKKREKST